MRSQSPIEHPKGRPQVLAPKNLGAGQYHGILHEAPLNIQRHGGYRFGINEDEP